MNGLCNQSQIAIEMILNEIFLRCKKRLCFFVRSGIGRKEPDREKRDQYKTIHRIFPTGWIHWMIKRRRLI